MMLSEKQQLFAQHVALLIQYITQKQFRCTLAEAYRTPEQAALNAQRGVGIKNSLHCQRLAIDLNLFSPDNIYLTDSKSHEPFGIYWESLDPKNKWGGRFAKPDGNHYERQI